MSFQSTEGRNSMSRFCDEEIKESLQMLIRADRLRSEVKRCAAEILGSFDLDKNRKALPFRIAILFRLNHSTPNFFVDRSGLVKRYGAIKTRDAALRQERLTQFRLFEEDRDFGSIMQVLV